MPSGIPEEIFCKNVIFVGNWVDIFLLFKYNTDENNDKPTKNKNYRQACAGNRRRIKRKDDTLA